MSKKELTPKQQRFVEEYLVDLNATQAAIRAGYSEKTAKDMGCQNLAKPNIAMAIQAGMDKRSKRTEITQDFVLESLAKLAGVNLDDITRINDDGIPEFDFSAVTKEQMYCLSEIVTDRVVRGTGENKESEAVHKIRVKTVDKLKALEMLGRHFGLFSHDINLKTEGVIFNLNYGGR